LGTKSSLQRARPRAPTPVCSLGKQAIFSRAQQLGFRVVPYYYPAKFAQLAEIVVIVILLVIESAFGCGCAAPCNWVV
jgi:hypothetical protein